MSIPTGLELTFFGPGSDGPFFRWRYRRSDIAAMASALQKLMLDQTKFYIAQITPCEEPPEPMSMEKWIAAGGTTD